MPEPALPKTTDLRETLPPPTPVVSLRPIALPAPGRGEDLKVRVTAPASGDGLPVLVFSHGFGGSMNEYAPLVDFWAASGFAVVQPTHLDSRTLGVPPEDPRTPHIWRHRIEDLVRVLDGLPTLEAAVPGPPGGSTTAGSPSPVTPGEPSRRARCWARASWTPRAYRART